MIFIRIDREFWSIPPMKRLTDSGSSP